MITTLITKEIAGIIRDTRLLLLFAVMAALLATALLSGYNHFAVLQIERQAMNAQSRQEWDAQDEKHAHSAAHYGTFIYAPQPLLSFFDFGVKNYAGSTIRVEAHLQRDSQFSAANDSGGSIRFGDMNVALVLQLLMPLLLIFIAFNSVSGERESGTLKLLLAQGIAPHAILRQKVAAHFLLAVTILLLVTALSAALAYAQGIVPFSQETALRLLLMLVLYMAFYFIVVAFAVGVSALSASSRNALLILLSLWFVTMVILPKTAANLGDQLYPLPSKMAFQIAVDDDVGKGIDAHNPENEQSKAFVAETLRKYNAKSIGELDKNIDGLKMQAEEDYRANAIKTRSGDVYRQIERQNGITYAMSLLNPVLAVKELSMALAETNYFHQVHFERQAQAYRLEMIRYLNDYITHNLKADDWETKTPRDILQGVKKFTYTTPSLSQSLQPLMLPIIAMLIWLVLASGFVNLAAKKMKVL